MRFLLKGVFMYTRKIHKTSIYIIHVGKNKREVFII